MAHPRDVLFTGRSDPPFFERLSTLVTRATGTPWAFLVAALVVIGWGLTGPLFHFSDTWQLVINTSTTIVTFLMVFVIQQSQNKDTIAIQLKLNELIACTKAASNRLIDVEELSDAELAHIKAFYVTLAEKAKREDVNETHSLDEAQENPKPRLTATRGDGPPP
jgi:low affinity Fe/Cu permease